MADSLQSTLQCLHSLLNSRSPHRASQAAQYASDLYTLCVESVTDSELGDSHSNVADFGGTQAFLILINP